MAARKVVVGAFLSALSVADRFRSSDFRLSHLHGRSQPNSQTFLINCRQERQELWTAPTNNELIAIRLLLSQRYTMQIANQIKGY